MPKSNSVSIIHELTDLWTDEDQDRAFDTANEQERSEAFLEAVERRVLELVREV